MNAMNVDNPEFLHFHSERLREVLGRDWIEEQLSLLNQTAHKHPMFVINGFRNLPEWVDNARKGRLRVDESKLTFAWTAYIISMSIRYSGGDRFAKELREYAQAGRHEQFLDVLFEGETAQFWINSMRAKSVSFGPPSGNPDILVEAAIDGKTFTIPIECKRVSTDSPESTRLDELILDVENELRPTLDKIPLKIIVWFHRPVQPNDAEALAISVRQLIRAHNLTGQENTWVTTADPNGQFQVSISPLGLAASWQWPGPHIADVPAEGRILVHDEGIAGQKVRIRSVIALRSDRVLSRVGNLKRQVSKAITQLRRSVNDSMCGVISIGIRPPRNIADLFESDAIVRKALRDYNADHVAAVFLHWMGSDRNTASERTFDDGTFERTVVHKQTFQHYVIDGPNRQISFAGLDSKPKLFPDIPPAFIRNPQSGMLNPITLDKLNLILDGADVEDRFILDITNGDPANEDISAAVYLGFLPDFWKHQQPFISSIIKVDNRQFRTAFEAEHHLKTLEFVEGKLVSIATTDLRAWIGTKRLLYFIICQPQGFYQELIMPDEMTRLRVQSSRVLDIPEWR